MRLTCELPFYIGVEAPLSYIERLVETLHPIRFSASKCL
nr:MAG TPA: hypothetical protein [Caudoviricetes sp.]